MPAINDWLDKANKKLASIEIPSAHLDAELLLAYAIKKTRTYLHAHGEQVICLKELDLANSYLDLRIDRMPIAYIIGQKEFYSRNFTVTQSTLIPRPESETIIELLSEIIKPTTNNLQSTNYNLRSTTYDLLDLGTGSGCLGITAKLEFPHLEVNLADISPKALDIARLNAKPLKTSVNIVQSDLFTNLNQKFDIILANLPYVDKKWNCSPETIFEPSLALFANDNGESIIKRLINDVLSHLNKNGYLIIEADPRQHKSLINYAENKNLIKISQKGYSVAFKI
jgi:release factor glutamine methyltransferase